MMKKNLLISACLLGIFCRYDGGSNPLSDENLKWLKDHFILIPVCPEQLGGLPTPRQPSEIVGEDRVIRRDGLDVSTCFLNGAKAALSIAKITSCELALLKANSPSCGNRFVYDGHFNGTLIPGQGVTAKLFENAGIKVYNELEIEELRREI